VRGYSPVATNQLDSGGVSRRRSGTFTVDLIGRLPFRTVSDPATILDQTEYFAPGTVVTVPDKRGHSSAGYLFSWWDLNGVRQEDLSGVAVGTFAFTLSTASTATAHYLIPTADGDGDGLLDWHEMTYYGTLAYGPDDDTDGDGFTAAMEVLRSYSPRVPDVAVSGGVSRRRSVLTAVNAVFLPNPPAIGLNAANEITRTSARLSTTVNPIGSPTTLVFQWGLTTTYGNDTPIQNVGNGLLAITATAEITGLTAGTVYHFRVVATNAQGTSESFPATFRTLTHNYGSWAETHAVGAPTQDFDADGLSNFMEFATGSDPAATTGAPGDLTPNAGLLHFTYQRTHAALADNVTFIVEWSDTLATGSWSTFAVSEEVLADDGTQQTVRATLPAGPGSHRFVRLRVFQP
jgi:hypothetical protein